MGDSKLEPQYHVKRGTSLVSNYGQASIWFQRRLASIEVLGLWIVWPWC